MITFITPTQGNPIALKRTLDSFKDIVSEVIVGSVCVFEDDKDVIKSFGSEYNLKFIDLPFHTIFNHGFGATLNTLATHSANDLILYMNVGEVVDGQERVLKLLTEKFTEYNCFALDHAIETHSWFRLYNKKNCYWSGVIHETLVGERIDCPYYIFRFKDTPKDMNDPLKAKVYDSIKEIVYFKNYMRLVDNPGLLGGTNEGWLTFAKDQYQSMKERLDKKGRQVEAFETGNLELFLKEVGDSDYFEKERFETSRLIEYQNSKMYL